MVTYETKLFWTNFEILVFISRATAVGGHMSNKTLKWFQNYFKIILFYM